MIYRLCGIAPALDGKFVCNPCRERALAAPEISIKDYYCSVCGFGPRENRKFDAQGRCSECQSEHASPRPMRPRVPCRGCGSQSLVRVPSVLERDGENPKPLALRYRRFTVRWLGSAIDPQAPHGFLEAYVCRGCGLTELYTKDFAELPIGPEFGTELFDVPVEPPYR